MNSSAQTLQGLSVMLTRPQGLAENLARQIEAKGGAAILYPVIQIQPPDAVEHRDQLLKKLASFDIAIFISPTSVNKTFELIDSLPAGIQIAAIGSSTHAALSKRGIDVSIIPQGHDSQALLLHARLQPAQLAGKSVIIFRGQGGRELLGDTLVSRGASVDYAEIYKRVCNDNLPPLTKQLLSTVDIIAVTSNEGLQNLYALAQAKYPLKNTPLLVPGERCHKLARELGFSTIHQAQNATDSACLQALETWASKR